MYTADVDIGGTFTDGFFTSGGEARRSKVLTTPHDLTECFLNCLKEGAASFGVPAREFLRQTLVVRLSTTLGTNTLIQRRGPKVGLLVTQSHERDLYGLGEAAVLRLFLPPEMVLGVREEVDAQGESVLAPEPAEVLAAVRQLVNLGARMIAVSFARSWRNPEHERAVRAIVRERYPEHYLRSIPLQLGHEVSPSADDHARANTVVLNAYLHRELAREQGLAHPLLVVHAGGGCARVAKTVAVQTLSSGPAVAISGAAALAHQLGLQRVATADMGGTSLDVALLDGGAPPVARAPRVAGLELAVPMIETESVGAGGGSIARVVNGQLQVGPQSAGSAPGPACYDKGGMEPTVTDANLLLGFLDAERFLGGRMRLNRKRAEAVLARRLARPLGLPVQTVAARVRARINATMAAELAARLRAHGGDPAEFTLFAFGGGGPLHGCAIAELAGLRRVVGFPFGSVFSAFGSSTVDVRHQYWRNLVVPLASASAADRVAAALADLRRQAALDMRGEGFAPGQVSGGTGGSPVPTPLDIHGEGFAPGQVQYGLELVLQTSQGERRRSWPAEGADGGVDLQAVLARLRLELPADAAETVELRALVLDAHVAIPHWLPTAAPTHPYRPKPRETRPVRWATEDDTLDTPLFDLAALEPGAELAGPAIVEAPDTSYAVAPGWQARVDAWGNVVMERG
ncbi:MAG: hydantoinase/oxoprolinase family protein [Chloroflexi bacterium]|nr:hydantoinase/oxoprolinase family protein [Chloroflexota bacterium]